MSTEVGYTLMMAAFIGLLGVITMALRAHDLQTTYDAYHSAVATCRASGGWPEDFRIEGGVLSYRCDPEQKKLDTTP